MKFAFFKAKGTLLDAAIRWWMRGTYSHVETVLEDFEDGTFLIASSVPGIGVRTTRIPLPASDYDVVDGPGDVEAARDWFALDTGKPSDYIGLFGFLVRPAIGANRTKFWCSEACLQAIGFPDPWRYDPNAMHDVISYAGKLAASSTTGA